MTTFSNDWFQRHADNWLNFFKAWDWKFNEPKVAIEIGVFEGAASCWILENLLAHPDSHLYAIDTFQGGIDHTPEEVKNLQQRFSENIASIGAIGKVQLGVKESHAALHDLTQMGAAADFVYIDGSHQTPDVLEDLVLSYRLGKPGCIYIADDYGWSMEGRGSEVVNNDPKLAIDSFINCYRRKIDIMYHQPPGQFAWVKR